LSDTIRPFLSARRRQPADPRRLWRCAPSWHRRCPCRAACAADRRGYRRESRARAGTLKGGAEHSRQGPRGHLGPHLPASRS